MDIKDLKDKEFRAGSMGAAENKGFRIARIVVGIVYLLILGVIFVFPNYQNQMQERAGALLGVLGFLMIVASYVVFYFVRSFNKVGIAIVLIGGLLVFGWLVAVGFQGSLSFY